MHIVVGYHFINEHVDRRNVELYLVNTDYRIADFFTKALPQKNLIIYDIV